MSEALAVFHFLRPWWLLLAPVAVGLWWLERRRGDTTNRWRSVIDPNLLRHLIVAPPRRILLTPASTLLATAMIAIVTIAGPTWQREPSPFADAPPPAVIVLKVTKSMLATDLAPTRLERAQQKIADLLAKREGAATGLVAYGGSAHLVLPPTADAEVVRTMAQALSPEIMPRDGDHLTDAMEVAFQVLAGNPRGGAVLLLADTVAPDQLGLLRARVRSPATPPVFILAMLSDARMGTDGTLRAAATALDATLVSLTPDPSDVTTIARKLATAAPIGDIVDTGERWRDAGYWAVPALVLMVLGAFRRGWVLP